MKTGQSGWYAALLVGVEQFAMDAIPQWKQFQARDF